MGYLHDQGSIHCDIKPDNYLVHGAEVKLIDFSIAEKNEKKGIGSLLSGLGKSKIRGTRSYMSPEQILGQRLTPASDIYSFACMLFEILAATGPPFRHQPQRTSKQAPAGNRARTRRHQQPNDDRIFRSAG